MYYNHKGKYERQLEVLLGCQEKFIILAFKIWLLLKIISNTKESIPHVAYCDFETAPKDSCLDTETKYVCCIIRT